jgi:hypothetical protein
VPILRTKWRTYGRENVAATGVRLMPKDQAELARDLPAGVAGDRYPCQLGLRFVDLADPDWFSLGPTLAWGFYGHRLVPSGQVGLALGALEALRAIDERLPRTGSG